MPICETAFGAIRSGVFGSVMIYRSERQFEAKIRGLLEDHVTSLDPNVYALKSKKAVDIVVCRDAPQAELFFIEVKYHKRNHGRLGFGGGKGGGFQPELLSRKPAYFEKKLRWALASETHQPGKIFFLTSELLRRKYVSGNKVEHKYNNIKVKLFRERSGLSEHEFIRVLRGWLGVKDPRSVDAPVPLQRASSAPVGKVRQRSLK